MTKLGHISQHNVAIILKKKTTYTNHYLYNPQTTTHTNLEHWGITVLTIEIN